VLDSFYAELSRCRARCTGRKQTEHRTTKRHDCDDRCRPHVCKPLSDSTVRQIHWILIGALSRAVRWRWIAINPMDQAIPPAQPRPDPRPPSPAEAGRILEHAATDADWGTLLWLAITTGARRGELCALRWTDIDLENAVVSLRRSLAQVGGKCWEKDTKSHQQRRVALDEETVSILRAYRKRWQEHALALGTRLRPNAFVFSRSPDASTHLRPDSVTQRYGRTATRLGIETTLHKLRHYSATELISAGVDIRTVAGRLGHGGGGLTTLRVFRLGSRIRPVRRRLTCRQATPTPLAKRTPGPAAPEPPGHG
jgi:integrase